LVSEKYFDRTNAKSKLIIFPDYYNTLKKIYSELDTIYDKNDNIWKVTKDLGFGLDEYY
jgi:ERCC4-related helicase